MSEEKKEEEASFDAASLPLHLSDKLEELYKEALLNKDTVQGVLLIQKAKDFIERAKLTLTKKKEKAAFGRFIDELSQQIASLKAITSHLEEVKKRNGEFIMVRRFMDLVIHKTKASSATMEQVEHLFRFTLLFCTIDNPHIKSVQASYHLLQVFIAQRIEKYAHIQQTYKKIVEGGGPPDPSLKKKVKGWLADEERHIKIYKELSTSIKLGGARDLLGEELSDEDVALLKENKTVADSQCPKKVKAARQKYYFLVGNMSTVPPLFEHVREYSLSIIGGKDQLHTVQDLSMFCCIIRTYVQEMSRLQQYIHISPKEARKNITTMLNHANPYVFAGYRKVPDIPKQFFELTLLENIGYYLTYYVLLVGGIFKSPQIQSQQIQALLKGTLNKLNCEKANKKVRDMLQSQMDSVMTKIEKGG